MVLKTLLSLSSIILLSCSEPDPLILTSDELGERIQMAVDRFVYGIEPAITEDFLLAGLTLDPQFKRRFTLYSGDQSGRYLSTFAQLKVEDNPINIHRLVQQIIANQKSDGRFGSETLDFTAGKLQGNHMALLWGNGRLLNGLLDYYKAHQDAAVLKSAKKLGDFLISITACCMQPDIIEKFKKKGAMGFICFTQNIEGLVKLYNATNNRAYIEVAEKIYPLLPEMGSQHSHGYLNTLRGILQLYNITKRPEQLTFVTTRYKEILESDSYLVNGGVAEFFGGSGSVEGYRDEGCSEADWLMLSLELWQTTGQTHYLDKAEYCLMNAMMSNQFNSGDFGHHHIKPGFGYILSECEGRAWWCCTYHGLQAMLKAHHLIVTRNEEFRNVNLFYNCSYRDRAIGFTFNRMNIINPTYRLIINHALTEEVAIGIRKPYWVKKMTIKLNGQSIPPDVNESGILIRRMWKSHDHVDIKLDYKVQIITRDHKSIPFEKVTGNLYNVALQYGPYLMSIDDGLMPAFMAEPAMGNILLLNKETFTYAANNMKPELAENTRIPDGYLLLNYQHDGFYGENKVIMRPLSEITHQRLANARVWFNLKKQ
jgi:DUF1680 family protein